jgi:hypothetical protein
MPFSGSQLSGMQGQPCGRRTGSVKRQRLASTKSDSGSHLSAREGSTVRGGCFGTFGTLAASNHAGWRAMLLTTPIPRKNAGIRDSASPWSPR